MNIQSICIAMSCMKMITLQHNNNNNHSALFPEQKQRLGQQERFNTQPRLVQKSN
jgi:hypothetical protein